MRMSSSKKNVKNVSRPFLCFLLIMLAGVNALSASGDGKIDAAQLKPEVLYIDLANPSAARGIALANSNEVANLVTKEIGGMAAAEPKNGYIVLTLDPAVVKPETPMLVAFSYYDTGWNEPTIYGFLDRPDTNGFYTGTGTQGGAFAEAWRWWTTFTYANYRGIISDGKQSSLRLQMKDVRWILALPMNETTIKQMNGIREKVLAMLTDYSRLMVAEASLQESRGRLEQGIKYLQSGGEAPKAVTDVFDEVKTGAGQARLDMDKVIMEVLDVIGPAYLGLFDGKGAERLAAVDGFQQKVRSLSERYQALTAKAEQCMAGQVAAQCAKYGLKKVALTAPERLAPDHVITKKDIQDRFFLGLVRQIPSLILPQASIDSITKDQGIDSVYEYSLSNWVKPREDGSYDFSKLDRLLGESRGLRVELGMHNVPLLPGWAEKKFFGEKPEKLSSGKPQYDNYRAKAADGRWDGFCIWDPNAPRSFTASCSIWSDVLFNYACDFYHAIGKHYRDNAIILRYTLNSEGSVTYNAELGYIWDAALPYYREHLKKKFGDIQKLNQVFGSAYKGFDEIPLPKPGEGEKITRLTPAYYEYTQLCIERTKYVREEFARCLKETDPNHAVGEVQSSTYGGNVIDTYAISVNTPYDTFAAGDSDVRAVRYQYSYNRYHPKPIWMYEPYTSTTKGGKGYELEELNRRMLTANLWTWFFWGHQGIPFFNQPNCDPGELRTSMTDYRIADIMLWPSGCYWNPLPLNPSVRLASGALAALKPIQERLEGVLLSAPVVLPRIGLLESSTTHRVPWPASGTFSDVGQLQSRLAQKGKHFFFIPETALVEGVEPMDSYRVIIAAYATHLRPEARDTLLKWVKKGGILIGSGPTGLYDQYGRSEGGLPETVFGMKGLEYGVGLTEDSKVAKCSGAMAGREGISLWANKDFYWRLPSKDLAEGTRVLASLADGTPVVVERAYGKGKVILTATSIGPLLYLYWPMLLAEINNAQPVPEAVSSASEVNLQVRESSAGIRYLSVVNGNASTPMEATITVAGEFERPRDLTVGNGWVIPAVAGGGVTKFKIWVEPGMGSFIELGKSRTKLTGLSPEEEKAQMAEAAKIQRAKTEAAALAWQAKLLADLTQTGSARIDCGSDALYVDPRGRRWLPDQAYLNCGAYGNESAIGADRGNLPIAGTDCPRVYQTEAWGDHVFYRIPVPNGNYNVHLHFAETWGPNQHAGIRLISVKVENHLWEKKVDPFAEAGGFARAVVLSEKNIAVNDGVIDIELTGGVGIQGIEIEKQK